MIALLPTGTKVFKSELIAAELSVIETLQYSLQWASPLLYVDRFLQIMNLANTQMINLC